MATTLVVHAESMPLAIALPTTSMTLAQFYDFCAANPDLRIERTATGDVIVMPPAFSDTGNRNFNISAHLWVWAEQDGTGIGFDSSTGFTLPNGATRSPDAAWIKSERWNQLTDGEKASFAPICPDFVIELQSASDTLNRLQSKLEEYIANGASLGWLIDRKTRSVHIYRPSQLPQVIENPDQVCGDPELPGFNLPMARIW